MPSATTRNSRRNNPPTGDSSTGNWVQNEMERMNRQNREFHQQRQENFDRMMERQRDFVDKVQEQHRKDSGTNSTDSL